MGLDTSHGAWHGPYSQFNAFRRRVAQLAGFPPLEQMEGFGGGHLTPGKPVGTLKWGDTPGDTRLIPFLHHSDCDGEISPADCLEIANAMEDLALKIGDPEPSTDDHWWKQCLRRFAAGCRSAYASNEPLDFH